MDPNGTRYHLLLGERDWTADVKATPRASYAYDTARDELTLGTRPFLFERRPGDRPPRLEDRRGAAPDRFGNLYWIAPNELSILALSAGSGLPSVFWRPGLATFCEPARAPGGFGPPPEAGPEPPPVRAIRLRGLAVTEDHYLVVGTVDPPGILAFDLHSPGPPRQALWPPDTFTPFDMCPRRGGGVFVLDRDRCRLWQLDQRLRVVQRDPASAEPTRADFAPLDPAAPATPGGECVRASPITIEDGRPLGGDPIALEAAPGGRVLVLHQRADAPPSTIQLVDPEAEDLASAPGAELADRVIVVAHDMALESSSDLGRLYVADAGGNQAFAYALSLHGDRLVAALVQEYFPMRLFGGKALVMGADTPLYDFGEGWIPLVRQGRPRYAPLAVLEYPRFDGRLPATVWHRLLLDACIPPETSVAVETRAGDDPTELKGAQWQQEPPLVYRRDTGSELPYTESGPSSGYGTFELLFQRARGRFLQIRLTLNGDGRTSPRLRALRAYFPRFSYLDRYLPKVYREDEQSAAFLDRFLANIEGIQTGVEDRVAGVQTLFDPRTAPANALDWLIGWFDFAADPTWRDERKRLFLRHASDFFALRGTIAGIQLALRLALDRCDDEGLFEPETPGRSTSRIVERYRTRQTPAVVLGDPTEGGAPQIVDQAARWEPAQGGEALTQRWRDLVGSATAAFPLNDTSELWRGFVRDVLGIEPPGAIDTALWVQFLASRYGRIDALDAAYGLVGNAVHPDFTAVAFPQQLPPDGAALRDWFHFVAVVLPAQRTAHRFTVLLPVPPTDERGPTPEERRAIAERVVELQKPAHTTFDVKFFWAAFRIGEARLAEDTLLGLGSRDPRLHQPMVLGLEHAGESFLGGGHAPTADRTGRDPLHRAQTPLNR
jgi:phage tail-like protein